MLYLNFISLLYLSFYLIKVLMMFFYDIVFLAAMKNEAESVVSNMIDIKSKKFYDNEIFTWKLFGHDVAVVVFDFWKVNAARATQYAIDVLWAKKIINIWFAWWLNSSLVVWSTYQIKAAVQYDYDIAQLNKTDIWVLNEFSDKYLHTTKLIDWFESKILGTWDRFNDSINDYHLLVDYIWADLRDMEWAAIIHTCIHAWVPVYAFKTVSDIAGSWSTTDQFIENMKLCSKNLTNEIKKIVEQIF